MNKAGVFGRKPLHLGLETGLSISFLHDLAALQLSLSSSDYYPNNYMTNYKNGKSDPLLIL